MKKLFLLPIIFLLSCSKQALQSYAVTFAISNYASYSGSFGSGHSGASKVLTGNFTSGQTMSVTMTQDSVNLPYGYNWDCKPAVETVGKSGLTKTVTFTKTF